MKNVIVLSDFDGTIFDTNMRLFDIIGEKEFMNNIMNKYLNKEISLKTSYELEFNSVKLTEYNYLYYMINDVKLQMDFTHFITN